MGDFNSNLLVNDFDTLQICEFLESSNFHLVPFRATHHTCSSSTLFDLCIIDNKENLNGYGQCPVPFLSAHDLIFISLRLRIDRLPASTVKIRDFRTLDVETFLEDLSGWDWSNFTKINCVDEMLTVLNYNLISVLDRHAPMREITRKRSPAPWLNNYIIQRMKERDRARRAWRRYGKPELHYIFRKLRNEVQSHVREAKKKYYLTTFSHKRGIASTWGELKRFRLLNSSTGRSQCSFNLDELNAAFILSPSPHPGAQSVSSESHSLTWDSGGFDDMEFFFADISPKALMDAIHKGKSEAAGVDNISSKCLRLALTTLLPYLLHLFNYILQNSLYPALWQSALVRPIPKVKFPSSAADFRPLYYLYSAHYPKHSKE